MVKVRYLGLPSPEVALANLLPAYEILGEWRQKYFPFSTEDKAIRRVTESINDLALLLANMPMKTPDGEFAGGAPAGWKPKPSIDRLARARRKSDNPR